MKNKKFIIGIIVAIILVIIAIVTAVVLINNNAVKPEDIFNLYISKINDKKYDEMYSLISESSKTEISQEDFVNRNKNIYEGIDAYDIKVTISEVTKEKGIYKISYNEKMSTSAGIIEFSNTAKLIKENK